MEYETTAPTAPSGATATDTAVPLTWKRLSIGQQFAVDTVTSIAIDPKDEEVLYVGTRHAGIYKSIDGGTSWKPAVHGLQAADVTSLAVDSFSTSRVYAGTRLGVFKTEDGGENWTRIGEGTAVIMDRRNSSHLYSRDDQHIYETLDGGSSWESVYSMKGACPAAVLSMVMHPADGRTLFVGGEGNTDRGCEPAVYRSDDSGRTWVLEQPGDIQHRGLDALTLGLDRLAVGLDQGGNYLIRAGEVVALEPPGLTLYYCDTHLCRSGENDGQTVTLGKPGVGVPASIVVSPSESNTIYVGGQGVSVSKDGGLTWRQLNSGFGTTSLILDAGLGTPPALYVQVGECDEGNRGHTSRTNPRPEPGQELFVSNDGGLTWEVAIRTGCYLIRDADGATIYRTGQSYAFIEGSTDWTVWIWRSQDAGKSWEKVLTPAFAGTLAADIVDGGILYLHNGGGTEAAFDQYVSDDYGSRWRAKDPAEGLAPCYGSTLRPVDRYRPMAVDPQNGNHVFVVDNGELRESNDSCATTEISASAPNHSMNSVAFDTRLPKTVYARDGRGRVCLPRQRGDVGSNQ